MQSMVCTPSAQPGCSSQDEFSGSARADPEHPLIEDLKRKDFVASIELTEQDACQADFIDQYTDMCKKQTPFIRFLTEAVGLAW